MRRKALRHGYWAFPTSDWRTARAKIVNLVGEGKDGPTPGQIAWTRHATRVLELALREALALGHDYIGTEHILLGLVAENEGIGARIFLDFEANAKNVRDQVIRMRGRSAD